MRVIIAGSRNLYGVPANAEQQCEYEGRAIRAVERAIKLSGFAITSLVCGMARGVDMIAYQWALNEGIWGVEMCPADWANQGKKAGFIRNVEMSKKADALIAVWNGTSNGTLHMINAAEHLKRFVYFAPSDAAIRYNDGAWCWNGMTHADLRTLIRMAA